jgi:hypothetical protein
MKIKHVLKVLQNLVTDGSGDKFSPNPMAGAEILGETEH